MQRRMVLIGIAASTGTLVLTPRAAFTDGEATETPVAGGGQGASPVAPAGAITVTTAINDPRPFSLAAALPPASVVPTPPPGVDRVLTLADSDQTIMLAAGMQVLLALGDEHVWSVQSADPAVLRPIPAGEAPGAQGLFATLQAGETTLTAIGEPHCRQAQPPCLGTPTLRFRVRIVVH